jgi:hypothetical protein
MLDKKLKEALELLGGKAILEDQGQYYILMNIKEFKKIAATEVIGLTKQELVDKINNDIASWKITQEEKQADEMSIEEIIEMKNEEIRYEKSV